MQSLQVRRGLRRLGIALSILWAVVVGGLFVFAEANRWWDAAPILISTKDVDRFVSGKTVEIEKIGIVTFLDATNDGELAERLRIELGETIATLRNAGRSDIAILDQLVSVSADPAREKQRIEWARSVGYSDKEIIAYLAARNAGGQLWETYRTRLPDGTVASVNAPNRQVAEDATRKYWNDQGGWLNHRWTYWAATLLIPILALYALGWTIAWIIAGFRPA